MYVQKVDNLNKCDRIALWNTGDEWRWKWNWTAYYLMRKNNMDADMVFRTVEKEWKSSFSRDNQPAYLILKVWSWHQQHWKHWQICCVKLQASRCDANRSQIQKTRWCMRLLLLMKFFVAGSIFKKMVQKQKYNQIRARCSHYPEMFEALPGNIIKLRVS